MKYITLYIYCTFLVIMYSALGDHVLLFCFVCIFNVVMQCSHGEANNVYFNKVYHCNELLHKMLRLIEFILRSISHHFLSVHYSLESHEKNIVYSQETKRNTWAILSFNPQYWCTFIYFYRKRKTNVKMSAVKINHWDVYFKDMW